MPKKYILLSLILICQSFIKVQAQSSITGTITDTIGNSLRNVTVAVIDASTKAVKDYCITNSTGYFEIKLTNIKNSILRITSIGYLAVEININDNVHNYNITLKAGTYILPEVIVKKNDFITGEGDTLNYNIQKFIRPQDRTIGDVIKNLPGITVSPTGTIIYNGKPINKFYIDGDDLLGDKYVIGANTIPADVVTTVQVLENHQPIKILEDRVFSENAALNIKLQESAKLRIFGSGNLASGIPFNSTDARVNTLSFKKKLKFINSYSFNSIGGNLSNEIKSQNINSPWLSQSNTIPPQLLNFTKLPEPIIPNRYFINNTTHLFSLNNLLPISNEKSIRFTLYWLPDINTYDIKTKNTFYIPSDTINQFENQSSKLKTSDIYLNCTYILNSKNKYVYNQLTFQNFTTNGNSTVENEINTFSQTLRNNNTIFQNSFLLKKTIRKNILFEAASTIKYYKYPENLNVGLGIYPWLLNNNIVYQRTNQLKTQDLATLSAEVSMAKKVKQFNVSLKTEFLLENIKYDTWINLTQPNNEIKKADSIFQNNFNWIQQRIVLSPSVDYKSKSMQFSISLPLLFRFISYANSFSNFDTSLNKISLHPSLRLNFTINNYSNVLFTVRRESEFTQPNNLLSGGILSNYRNLSQKIQSLQFNNSNTYAINYSYRNPIKIKFFTTAIIYSSNFSPIIPIQNFYLGLIQNNQQLFSNITQRIMVLANYSKYIFPLKTTIKFGYNGTGLNYFQIQNNLINNLRSITHSTNLSIITKPKWYFNCEINFNYMTSKSKNLTQNTMVGKPINIFNTNYLATYNFSENTFIQIEASHIVQKSSNNNGIFLTDFLINHTIQKTKTNIGIKVINIFNESRFVITNLDGIQVSTNDYWLRPLTIMLSASFRF